MTKPWTITPEWQGGTVAVMASGPSMSAEVAEALRHHFCIVVNYAVRIAPWADMLVALDGNWPQEFREFEGLRVAGFVDDDTDALYAGQWWERIRMGPTDEIEIRNSGLAAIRIAAAMGAARIILAGFDPELRGHFYDDEVETGEYVGLTAGLAAITAELTARGIAVERFAQVSDLAAVEFGEVINPAPAPDPSSMVLEYRRHLGAAAPELPQEARDV